MSYGIASLVAQVRNGAKHVLDAWAIIRRHEEDIRNARDKLHDEAFSLAVEEGGGRVFKRGTTHFYPEIRQQWTYDHNAEWVAAKNRIETIERSMREEHDEPATKDENKAARRGPDIKVLRVYLRNVPKHLKRGEQA